MSTVRYTAMYFTCSYMQDRSSLCGYFYFDLYIRKKIRSFELIETGFKSWVKGWTKKESWNFLWLMRWSLFHIFNKWFSNMYKDFIFFKLILCRCYEKYLIRFAQNITVRMRTFEFHWGPNCYPKLLVLILAISAQCKFWPSSPVVSLTRLEFAHTHFFLKR